MNYIDSTLAPGEEVAYTGQISIASMMKQIFAGLFVMAVSLTLGTVGIISFVAGLGLLIYVITMYQTSELAITNLRIIAKHGFNIIEIPIRKVESLQVRQSAWGKIWGFGTVIVAGAGNPRVPIANIRDPLAFRQAFAQVADGWKE
jgi:hypothetical protein